MNYRKKALLSDQISTFNFLVGQSHDVWRSYSFFAARVASFASVQMMLPRGTQIKYMRRKSCDYHYHQYTRPNRTNLFHKGKLFNMKSCGGLQIPLQFALCRLAREKLESVLERVVCHLASCSDNNASYHSCECRKLPNGRITNLIAHQQ